MLFALSYKSLLLFKYLNVSPRFVSPDNGALSVVTSILIGSRCWVSPVIPTGTAAPLVLFVLSLIKQTKLPTVIIIMGRMT